MLRLPQKFCMSRKCFASDATPAKEYFGKFKRGGDVAPVLIKNLSLILSGHLKIKDRFRIE